MLGDMRAHRGQLDDLVARRLAHRRRAGERVATALAAIPVVFNDRVHARRRQHGPVVAAVSRLPAAAAATRQRRGPHDTRRVGRGRARRVGRVLPQARLHLADTRLRARQPRLQRRDHGAHRGAEDLTAS